MRAVGFQPCAAMRAVRAANCREVKIECNGAANRALRTHQLYSSWTSADLLAEKGKGLEACDFEWFAAANVRARELVVPAHHIRLRFGEFGAISFICVARKLGTFAADYPRDFVFAGLAALGAGQVVGSCFCCFVEKIAFIHLLTTPVCEEARRGSAGAAPHEIEPGIPALAGLFHTNPLSAVLGRWSVRVRRSYESFMLPLSLATGLRRILRTCTRLAKYSSM
jgi:hypothetical protein